MGVLACTKCKTEYEETLENFPPHKKTKNKLDSWCRLCRREYRNKYRKPPDGISKEDWNKFDNFKHCLICGLETKLVTDHCHLTFKVRGKLCHNCNLGLGHFKDDPMLLEFAKIYLMNYSEEDADKTEVKDYFERYK
jgi:hypothetical protein